MSAYGNATVDISSNDNGNKMLEMAGVDENAQYGVQKKGRMWKSDIHKE